MREGVADGARGITEGHAAGQACATQPLARNVSALARLHAGIVQTSQISAASHLAALVPVRTR